MIAPANPAAVRQGGRRSPTHGPRDARRFRSPRLHAPRSSDRARHRRAGGGDGTNRLAYAGNDPINRSDPGGQEAWLFGRPLEIPRGSHMCVAVAPELGVPPQAIFPLDQPIHCLEAT